MANRELPEIDDLITAMAKPLFMYRMSVGVVQNPERYSERLVKGSRTKYNRAVQELNAIVLAYAQGESLEGWFGEEQESEKA